LTVSDWPSVLLYELSDRGRPESSADLRILRDNACMADGSIYVAMVSASAAILAAAVSAFSVARQNSRNAERDRQQRREEQKREHEEETRGVCMELLRAVVDLRTQVENNEGYQGDEMRSRLARVRGYASDATVHAVGIGTIEPDVFADLADQLAKAARNLAAAAAANTNLEMSMSTAVPDLGELNDCIEAFSKKAVAYAREVTKLSAPLTGKLACDLTMLR